MGVIFLSSGARLRGVDSGGLSIAHGVRLMCCGNVSYTRKLAFTHGWRGGVAVRAYTTAQAQK